MKTVTPQDRAAALEPVPGDSELELAASMLATLVHAVLGSRPECSARAPVLADDGGLTGLAAYLDEGADEHDAGGAVDLPGRARLVAAELRDLHGRGMVIVPALHLPVTWSEEEPSAGHGAKDPRPKIISLRAGGYGTTISERPAARIAFSRDEDGEDARVFYEGTIPQSDLFRALLAAGLLRRQVDTLAARR